MGATKNKGDTGEVDRSQQFPWHAKTKEECFKELGCAENLNRVGLTSADAASRLEKYGYNQMTGKEKVTIWQKIWHQVANVLVGILIFVAVISAIQAVRSMLANDTENIITWWIQVFLIVFVIT